MFTNPRTPALSKETLRTLGKGERRAAAAVLLGAILTIAISSTSYSYEEPKQHKGEPTFIQEIGAFLRGDWLQDVDAIVLNTEATLFHVSERVVDGTTREQLHRVGREDRQKDAARTALDNAIADAEKALKVKWPKADIRPSSFIIQYAIGGERELIGRVAVSRANLGTLLDSSDEKVKALVKQNRPNEEKADEPSECDIQLVMYVGGGNRDFDSPVFDTVFSIVYEITPDSSKTQELLRVETVRFLLRYSKGVWTVKNE